MEQTLFWLVPASSVLALLFAWYFHRQMLQESEGTPQMMKIAAAVRKGAMSYLKQQYKIVGIVFVCLAVMFAIMAYGFHVQNAWVPVAFLTGGFFSGLSGYLGMKTATYASARTANAARKSLNSGLRIAFRSGAVMGLVVVGLGLLDISFWYLLLNAVIPADAITPTQKLCVITTTMLTFGMGASTQALFARVGGGIYTKAADVGADLVGKVEAGIPEDDPRNPATIADNVGDNVGDVAGMGADLYESYCGSILATAALGAAAFLHSDDTVMQFKAVIAPMLIAAVGILLSLIGIFAVRTKENAQMKDLPAITSDGVSVSLNINAGLSNDLMVDDGVLFDGIGLYRTELPFMLADDLPDVKTQTNIYRRALIQAQGKPVIFRALDIGSDKVLPYFQHQAEENPALGWRSIRMTLDRRALLRNQLRAFIRAAAGRDLYVMFPMIASVREFCEARKTLMMEVDREKTDFDTQDAA